MNVKACGAAIAGVFLFAGSVAAQDTYAFTINRKLSSIESSFSATAPFTGSFIGNYDAEKRPDGTRTLLGAFGFCTNGNQVVTLSGTGSATGAPKTAPTGSFTLRIDTANERAVLYSLAVDLLGGSEPTIVADATMMYQAFRTCNPTGFFPSIDLPFELGEAVITRMTAEQGCGPAIGSIKEINPGEYTFSVPTTVVINPGLTFNGIEQETAPIEVAVVVAGTAFLGDVMANATARLEVNFEQTIKGPVTVADDQPFDLPNPLGGTVHLLLDLSLTSVTMELEASADMSANGMVVKTPCRSDWNADTVVNSQDFFDFLTSFFAGTADFDCSGTTNSQDFFDFLTAFFAGC